MARKNWTSTEDEKDFDFEDDEIDDRRRKKERTCTIKKQRERKYQCIEADPPIYTYDEDWE
ncbi:MAG: hypothetical protein WC516_09140 [Patescibacteria group bacterium]|jgi:hypothetical protein